MQTPIPPPGLAQRTDHNLGNTHPEVQDRNDENGLESRLARGVGRF